MARAAANGWTWEHPRLYVWLLRDAHGDVLASVVRVARTQEDPGDPGKVAILDKDGEDLEFLAETEPMRWVMREAIINGGPGVWVWAQQVGQGAGCVRPCTPAAVEDAQGLAELLLTFDPAAPQGGPRTLDVPVSLIPTDKGTQSRAVPLDLHTVDDYADSMRRGDVFPSVSLYFDHEKGVCWPGDGHHRIEAARRAGRKVIAASVKPGTWDDAFLESCGANAKHGLKRSRKDLRAAARRLLEHPTYGRRSASWLSQTLKCSQPFITKMQKAMFGPTFTVIGEDGKEYQVGSEEAPPPLRVVDAAGVELVNEGADEAEHTPGPPAAIRAARIQETHPLDLASLADAEIREPRDAEVNMMIEALDKLENSRRPPFSQLLVHPSARRQAYEGTTLGMVRAIAAYFDAQHPGTMAGPQLERWRADLDVAPSTSMCLMLLTEPGVPFGERARAALAAAQWEVGEKGRLYEVAATRALKEAAEHCLGLKRLAREADERRRAENEAQRLENRGARPEEAARINAMTAEEVREALKAVGGGDSWTHGELKVLQNRAVALGIVERCPDPICGVEWVPYLVTACPACRAVPEVATKRVEHEAARVAQRHAAAESPLFQLLVQVAELGPGPQHQAAFEAWQAAGYPGLPSALRDARPRLFPTWRRCSVCGMSKRIADGLIESHPHPDYPGNCAGGGNPPATAQGEPTPPTESAPPTPELSWVKGIRGKRPRTTEDGRYQVHLVGLPAGDDREVWAARYLGADAPDGGVWLNRDGQEVDLAFVQGAAFTGGTTWEGREAAQMHADARAAATPQAAK